MSAVAGHHRSGEPVPGDTVVEQHGAEDGRARVGHRFAASLWREHAQELDVHGEVVDAIDPAGATAADECHLLAIADQR